MPHSDPFTSISAVTADPLDTVPPASWSQSPLIALAILWTTVWSLVSTLEITRYIHDPAIPWWQPFTIVFVSTSIIALWLTVELRAARYFRRPLEPPRAWFIGQLPRLPLLAAGYIVAVFGIRHLIFALAKAEYWHLPWAVLIPYELVKIGLFYCLWLGLVYGTLSLLRLRERGAQLIATQKALAEAQLARLRAQLRPHFLFNTLNTVSSLMQSDVVRADRVLSRLGDLLRATLGAGEHDTVSLREEIHVLHLYADIMEERFPGRIVMGWQIADDALSVHVPAMILQPLLENAFKHGVEKTTAIEHVLVVATRHASHLQLEIHNTGSVLGLGWREGIGLSNCRERLRVRYGSAATFEVSGHGGGDVIARISIPVEVSDR